MLTFCIGIQSWRCIIILGVSSSIWLLFLFLLAFFSYVRVNNVKFVASPSLTIDCKKNLYLLVLLCFMPASWCSFNVLTFTEMWTSQKSWIIHLLLPYLGFLSYWQYWDHLTWEMRLLGSWLQLLLLHLWPHISYISTSISLIMVNTF